MRMEEKQSVGLEEICHELSAISCESLEARQYALAPIRFKVLLPQFGRVSAGKNRLYKGYPI
jgi:hypothetical protein